MKLEFPNKARAHKVSIGLRVSEEHFEIVRALADKNGVSVAETAYVLIRAALKEVKVASKQTEK